MDEPRKSQGSAESREKEEPTDVLLGVQIGNYRIVRKLGEGGMGAVYEAVHNGTSHRIAVKFLRQPVLGDSESEAVRLKRFLDEARALGAATHPNLVEFIDSGELPSGELYIMMELVAGTTLRDFVVSQGRKLPAPLALELTRQTAVALAFIHGLGIVHRDLNPRNLMVLQDSTARNGWRIKILDFGIAKFTDQREYRTRTQSQLGTIRYMSPEQCEAAKSVDESTDIYSLGLVLFELLTGESPYLMADGQETKWIDAHINRAPRPLRALWTEAPAPLSKLLAEMLDKHPEYRPRAAEIAAHLDSGEQIPERRGPISSNLSFGFLLSTALLPGVGSVSLTLLSAPKQPVEEWTRARTAVAASRTPEGMIFIPPVRMLMGETEQQADWAHEECVKRHTAAGCPPDFKRRAVGQRLVSVDPFYLDQFEMTNQRFLQVVKTIKQPIRRDESGMVFLVNGDKTETAFFHWGRDGRYGSGLTFSGTGELKVRAGFEKLPVVQVTQAGARRICERLGKELPTEAQYEAAARGSDGRRYPWGNDAPRCDGVTFDRVKGGLCAAYGEPGPSAVGSQSQDVSRDGVYDLAGNVYEWTSEPFVSMYQDCGSCRNPVAQKDSALNPTTIPYAIRGGSFRMSAEIARATCRSAALAVDPQPSLGFRCAMRASSGQVSR